MFWTLILALGLAVLLLWLLARPFYWSGKGIKFMTPKPIIGNFGAVSNGLAALGESLYKAFPEEKLYGIHAYMTPGLVIRDPEVMVDIAIKDFDHFSNNGLGTNQEHDLAGGNLLFLHGQQWKEVRSKVSPSFTPVKIKAMLSSVDVTLPKAMKILDESIRVGEPCNQTDLLIQIVNDVITQAVFGVESDAFEKDSKFKPLAEIFFSPKTTLMNLLKNLSQGLFKLFRLQTFDTDASLFLKRIVRDLVEYRNKNNVKGNDFVQGMMDIMEKHGKTSNGPAQYFPDGTRIPKYDFDEMFLHAFIIFLGGVESTATTLTWLFYELAKNPVVQEQCREEVMKVVAQKGRHVTLDDMPELAYTIAAIKEAVRMYPPFSLMLRICTKEYTFKESNVTVLPGHMVLFPTLAVQRDPLYFPDPDDFNPDRFMGEEPKTGYITTFGLGPRMCLEKTKALPSGRPGSKEVRGMFLTFLMPSGKAERPRILKARKVSSSSRSGKIMEVEDLKTTGKSFANYEMFLIVTRLLQKYRFKLSPKTQVPLVPIRFRPIYAPSTSLWLDVTHI